MERLRPVHWWHAALVAVPTAALFVLGYRRRWICDDGLIYLRPVRQILAGNGPVFNVGERAESSTGTLWQWLLALGTWVTGEDPAFLAVGLGLLLSTAGFALALIATCRLHRGAGLLLPAGVFVLLAVPPFWSYMTSGLESGLGACWTGLSWWLLTGTRRGQEARVTRAAAFVFGLGPLVRPDLAVVTSILLAAQWWVLRPSRRGTAAMLASAVALPLAYEVFRAGYYGILVPLPAIAKEASAATGAGAPAMCRRRSDPTGCGPSCPCSPPWPSSSCGASAGNGGRAGRAWLAVLLAPLAAGALLAGYVVRVGGDYMHARMILPPSCCCSCRSWSCPRPGSRGSRARCCWCGWALRSARCGHRSTCAARPAPSTCAAPTWRASATTTRCAPAWVDNWPALPEGRGMLARAARAPRPTLLYFDAGRRLHATPMREDSPYQVVIVGRHLGVADAAPLDAYVNDAWGLASPVGAHLALERWSWPGHEKFLRNHWVFAEWAVEDTRRSATCCGPGPRGRRSRRRGPRWAAASWPS
ncbi:Arabinofuranosyltransferase OS=Streptomyces violarus OX=67380 GN=FHS41_004015 PE=4 SV=1 [Streptomyces violarus]